MHVVPYKNIAKTGTIIQKKLLDDTRGDLVSLRTMKKILEGISENGRIKRTRLSVKTGMPYDRCMRYVNILKLLKMADIVLDDTSTYITITQTGIDFINLLDYA